MQRVIYVGEPNICFNAACRQTEEDLNTAYRHTPGSLKYSTLLATLGTLYRRENRVSKGRGSIPCMEHWITFSLSYSSPSRMRSGHCAAGDLTLLPVSRSTVVTYTSHINEYSDSQYLWHHAISTTFAGQHKYYLKKCLSGNMQFELCRLSHALTQTVQIPIYESHYMAYLLICWCWQELKVASLNPWVQLMGDISFALPDSLGPLLSAVCLSTMAWCFTWAHITHPQA